MGKHSVRAKLVCPFCQKIFFVLPYFKKNGRIFCSVSCRNKSITRVGCKFPKNTRQKISKALKLFYKDRWISKVCPTCGKEFKDYGKSKKEYCSKNCAYISPAFAKKISQSLLGRKLSESARRNVILAMKRRWRDKEYKIKVSKAISMGRIGVKVSELGKVSMSRAALINTLKGKNHWNWRGGITPIRERIRKIPEYKKWVREIFKRDNYICRHCGKKGGNIEVDHYPKQFSQLLDEFNIKNVKDALNCKELWNLNNGRTLCLECHIKTYKGVPKKIWRKL